MLKSIRIQGFKKIADLELGLSGTAAVLLGGNNSGKSSVLEALHVAVSAAQAVKLHHSTEPEWVEDSFSTVLGHVPIVVGMALGPRLLTRDPAAMGDGCPACLS